MAQLSLDRRQRLRQNLGSIHLDRVDGLGDFIEFDGVVAVGGDPSGFADLLDDLRIVLSAFLMGIYNARELLGPASC